MKKLYGTCNRILVLSLMGYFAFGSVCIASEEQFAKASDLLRKIQSLPPKEVPQELANEASSELNRAISSDPVTARAHTALMANMGQYYQLAGNNEASLLWWRKTVQFDDGDWRAWAKIVQCCQTAGDVAGRDEAKSRVQALHKLGKVDQSIFCVDQFTLANDKIMVFEHLKFDSELKKITYTFYVIPKDAEEPRLRYTHLFGVTGRYRDGQRNEAH